MTLAPGAGLRLIIVALALLVALQILIVGVGFFLRIKDLGEPTRPQIINQIAGAAALLDDKDAEQRQLALRAVNSPFIRYSLLDAFPNSEREARPLPEYRPIIDAYLKTLRDRPFKLIVRNNRPLRPWSGFRFGRRVNGDELVFIVGLKDGSALVVEPSPEYRRQVFINFLALMSSLVGVALLIGLVLASFATSRPLARMADNAEAFAANLEAPPLAESGPEPVRNLARAFNRMKTDIRRLVSERQTTLAAVAHDYRTYLTRLRLRAEYIGDEDQRAKTVADLDEMTALIDDTLFLAKTDHASPAFEAVDLGALAREVVAGAVESGGRATCAEESAKLQVKVHRRSLKRALANLVDNALKYGSAAHVVVALIGDQATISVEDEGKGVPEDQRARLTEPFYRVEGSRSRETGGAGLGLAIAKMLVEASGGSLRFDAASRGGLRAEITLPPA